MQTLSNRDFKKEHFLTMCKEITCPAEGSVDTAILHDRLWLQRSLLERYPTNYQQ